MNKHLTVLVLLGFVAAQMVPAFAMDHRPFAQKHPKLNHMLHPIKHEHKAAQHRHWRHHKA